MKTFDEEAHIHGKIELPKPKDKKSELLEAHRTAIKDIRYIMNHYGKKHPDEAWDTIRKIAYDPKLKGGTH